MFGIGFQEMLIILVVVLIFFGPKRLPDLAKSMGKGLAEFKKASEEVRKGIEEAVKEEEEPSRVTSPAAPSANAGADPPATPASPAEPPEPHQESIPFSVPSKMEASRADGTATPETGASGETTTPRQG